MFLTILLCAFTNVTSPQLSDVDHYWQDYNPRLYENSLLTANIPVKLGKPGLQIEPQHAIGDSFTFWISDMRDNSYYEDKFICAGIGEFCYIWVEADKWNNKVQPSHVEALRKAFDDKTPDNDDKGIYEVATEVFGEPPDVDGDQRIYLLILDILDEYTSNSQGVYTAGFFDPINEISPEEAISMGRRSNAKDIVHIDCNPANPASSSVHDVLAHEFQHLIHNRYDRREVPWVNEGMSTLAEFICGYGGYGGGYSKFTTKNSLIKWGDVSNIIDDYYQVFIFSMYLWEHYGENTIAQAIVQQPDQSIDGINKVLRDLGYNTTMDQLYPQFVRAVFLDNPNDDYHDGLLGFTYIDPAFSWILNGANRDREREAYELYWGLNNRDFPPYGDGFPNSESEDFVLEPYATKVYFTYGDSIGYIEPEWIFKAPDYEKWNVTMLSSDLAGLQMRRNAVDYVEFNDPFFTSDFQGFPESTHNIGWIICRTSGDINSRDPISFLLSSDLTVPSNVSVLVLPNTFYPLLVDVFVVSDEPLFFDVGKLGTQIEYNSESYPAAIFSTWETGPFIYKSNFKLNSSSADNILFVDASDASGNVNKIRIAQESTQKELVYLDFNFQINFKESTRIMQINNLAKTMLPPLDFESLGEAFLLMENSVNAMITSNNVSIGLAKLNNTKWEILEPDSTVANKFYFEDLDIGLYQPILISSSSPSKKINNCLILDVGINKLRFLIPEGKTHQLRIFDIQGRLVFKDQMLAGEHSYTDLGLPKGIYNVKVDNSWTRRLVWFGE
jgi:hypothetical protein